MSESGNRSVIRNWFFIKGRKCFSILLQPRGRCLFGYPPVDNKLLYYSTLIRKMENELFAELKHIDALKLLFAAKSYLFIKERN